MSALTTLNWRQHSSLADSSWEVESLPSLSSLLFQGCSSLVTLPKEVGNLSSLTTLHFQECSSLVTLPKEVGNLSSLTTLHFQECSSLVTLPKEVGNLPSLSSLLFQGCSSLVTLPKEVGNLSSLTTLHFQECSSLVTLSKEVGNLSSLRSLLFQGCSSLVTLPKEVENLSSLITLMFGCSNVSSLITLMFKDFQECSNLVLFLGSYVWIKSRPASFTANRRKRKSCPLADRASELGDELDVPRGVYRRAVKDTRGSVTRYKYEPRFKPRREKLESGTSLEFNYLPLGSYDTPLEAEIVRHLAAVLYGKEEARLVHFEDGLCLPFPSVIGSENCPPSGKEKADWVTHKTKELYAELLREKARQLQLLHPALETGSHHGHAGEARRRDPSPSAPGARSTALELTCFTSPHGGNGVEERSTSESHGLGQGPPLAREVFPTFLDSDFEPVISDIPQWDENDFLAMDDLDKVLGDHSETGSVFDFEFTSAVPPQSIALDIPASAIVARLPQLGGGDQGLEIIEPQLNSATAIPFQQLESHPEQVQLQQRVTYQEQRLEEFSGSNVELQLKLLESEVQISELQQKLRKSELENEKWKSMCRQFAKLISASDEDGSPVDIQ